MIAELTPEYSRFLLVLIVLVISAIAIIGWLYVATGVTLGSNEQDDLISTLMEEADEESLSEDAISEDIAPPPPKDWIPTTMTFSKAYFTRKAPSSVRPTYSARSTQSPSAKRNTSSRTSPNQEQVFDDSLWLYQSVENNSHNSHSCYNPSDSGHGDCSSYDSGSFDGGSCD